MSDETKKDESAIEESDAQSQLDEEQLEEAAGGRFAIANTSFSLKPVIVAPDDPEEEEEPMMPGRIGGGRGHDR